MEHKKGCGSPSIENMKTKNSSELFKTMGSELAVEGYRIWKKEFAIPIATKMVQLARKKTEQWLDRFESSGTEKASSDEERNF